MIFLGGIIVWGNLRKCRVRMEGVHCKGTFGLGFQRVGWFTCSFLNRRPHLEFAHKSSIFPFHCETRDQHFVVTTNLISELGLLDISS
jgi:hypothetical protein